MFFLFTPSRGDSSPVVFWIALGKHVRRALLDFPCTHLTTFYSDRPPSDGRIMLTVNALTQFRRTFVQLDLLTASQLNLPHH